MHYISIIEMLKILLQNQKFASHLKFMLEQHSSYHDFSDGSIFQSHPVVVTNPSNCLQIIAYYDELEICNPLGTNVKNIKLDVFSTQSETSIQNIDQHLGQFFSPQ